VICLTSEQTDFGGDYYYSQDCSSIFFYNNLLSTAERDISTNFAGSLTGTLAEVRGLFWVFLVVKKLLTES